MRKTKGSQNSSKICFSIFFLCGTIRRLLLFFFSFLLLLFPLPFFSSSFLFFLCYLCVHKFFYVTLCSLSLSARILVLRRHRPSSLLCNQHNGIANLYSLRSVFFIMLYYFIWYILWRTHKRKKYPTAVYVYIYMNVINRLRKIFFSSKTFYWFVYN